MSEQLDGWDDFDERLRGELSRPGSSTADRVMARIGGRSPQRMVRDGQERRLRHLTYAAALLFAALVTFHVGRGDSTPNPHKALDGSEVATDASTKSVPTIVRFHELAEEETSDVSSILGALFMEGRSK